MVGKPYWRHLPTYQEYLAAHPGPQVPCEGRVHDERYFVGLCPVADQLCLHGFRTIDGYAGLTPQRCLHYGSDINALRVAQVQVGRFWPPDLKWFGNHLGPPQGDDWRTVDGALPRVRLVTQAIPSIAPGDDLAKIPVETAALVSHPIDLPVSAPGTAELIEDRPGKISVAATAPQRQLLVLSEGYDTGWQVRIDRQPAMLERINGDFFGCVMDGGTHRVDFEYAPAGLRTGKIVSLFALLLTLLLAFGPLGAALLYSRLDRRQSIVVA
jgi:hypothetical protein